MIALSKKDIVLAALSSGMTAAQAARAAGCSGSYVRVCRNPKKPAIDAAYREANRDKLAAHQREYRKANREKRAAYWRAYYKANRDKIAEYKRAYRNAKKSFAQSFPSPE